MSFELLSRARGRSRNNSFQGQCSIGSGSGRDHIMESNNLITSNGHDSVQQSWEQMFDSMASLYRSNEFELYFLGMIQEVNLGGSQRDPDVQLIDRVEEAQLENKIQLFPREEDLVILTISKHGVKVLDSHKKEVLQRHPLHTVAQIVYYNDNFFKSNLAIKIGLVGRTVYDCYVFQCYNENQSQTICQSLKDVFDSIAHHTR